MKNRKLNDQEQSRYNKLDKLIELNKNPFKEVRFNRTHNIKEFMNEFNKFTKEELHNSENNQKLFLISGRVMNQRQTFGVIKDFSGKLQYYYNKKTLEESVIETIKMIDIGDIIGIYGFPMKTNTNELTINIKNLIILSKSLKVLPEKFHGLVDEELRARERYLDLIMNEDSLNVFIKRSEIIKSIRKYMDSIDFCEVETPVLQPILGGAAARPFITHHNTLNKNFYLRIATELPLKKLIVGGFEKIYEIGRIFRNEGMDSTHNPEFTSMEIYQAYVGMEEMMDLCENIFQYIVKECFNKNIFKYRGFDIDLSKKFKRINMIDLIKEIKNIDFNKIKTFEEAKKLAIEHKITLQKHENTIGHVINLFFEEFCEITLIQPTFVYGYPVEVSPLSKTNKDDNRYTDRFELFIGQKEFANAFSELNNPIEQYERFNNQLREKELGNSEANEMDLDFINALEYGLPPTGGIGIGIDRLIMLLTEQDTIRNVLLFPHMKDKN